MKINLPAEPVDGYEIRWYTIYTYECSIYEVRLVYHTDRLWSEVCPDEGEGGADFRDEWQIFENGRFTGRIDEWDAARTYASSLRRFATIEEARREARHILLERVARLEVETARYRQRLTSGDLAE